MKTVRLTMDDTLYRRLEEICLASGIERGRFLEKLLRHMLDGALPPDMQAGAPLSLFPEMGLGHGSRSHESEEGGGLLPRELGHEAQAAYVREMAKAYEG